MYSRSLRAAIFFCLLLTAVAGAWGQYSEWSTPVNLGSVVNSTYVDEGPFLSRDGLHLYFASDRPGGFGGSDIWVTTRANLGATWELPTNLGPAVNTSDNEGHPTLSTDGHVLYFDRMPVGGTYDMFRSRRRDKSDELGWGAAVNTGDCINSPANDSAMIFFEDESSGITYTYFNSNRSGTPEFYVTIYEPKGACAPVLPIAELNTPYVERSATIRHDGLEILFESNRPGSTAFDIWTATRTGVPDTWSMPVNVPALSSNSYDGRPALSWDGTEVYFFSDRGGDFDLYVSTRNRLK
jgi:Tol biopolymer transport system component